MAVFSSDDLDEARSEATFSFAVENFSSVKESVLSPPCIVRNLPWKIMIMPKITTGQDRVQTRSMGYFLQCNGESEAASWSCQASAELRIICHKDPSNTFVRKISHLFYSKENDWGFSTYMTWNDVADVERGFIVDDVVTFEVKVVADAPHGVCWDSKKHTGYVGLKNQGATCYMNSLLQVLYFTNILRKCVYRMPTEADDSTKSVGLALQRVFHDLQFMDKAVGTKKLTKSFGWETLDSFMQHDVQEFLRVLLDKLEVKMKGTCVEGTIPKLFQGKMVSYLRCKNVDYTSSRTESFYDIQLNIKGKKNIMESFRDYTTTESLDGDNKYEAGSYGLQDAEKGIFFDYFPPILHLHLMRFQYDPSTDSSVKFNDRFEFVEELDLSEFERKSSRRMSQGDNDCIMEHEDTEEDDVIMGGDDIDEDISGHDSSDATYLLHAVLVHSGDNHGGHYVVFINPNGDGKWCKFDDDVVSRCSAQEAIQYNFGGHDEDISSRQSTNAYMLVYIRKSHLSQCLCKVTEEHIPAELLRRLNEERKFELARRKEKSETHLYMTIKIILEDNFMNHQGNDLFDPEKIACAGEIRVKRLDTVAEVLCTISKQINYSTKQIRIWPFLYRTNQTYRPTVLDIRSSMEKHIEDVAGNSNPWTVLLEKAEPGVTSLVPFDKDSDVMLFFKYYDPMREIIHYMGFMHLPIVTKISQIIPELRQRAFLPVDTSIILYEEIRPDCLERIHNLEKPLEHVLDELIDGDIIVFQKELSVDHDLRLPYCYDYFREFFHKVDVTFSDKYIPNDPGFVLTLSQCMNYNDWSREVGKRLKMDPTHIQFFKTQSYRDIPGHPLRCTYEGTIKDLFSCYRPKQHKKMFYQRHSISIQELENKRLFKCSWLSALTKEGYIEKEFTLYPPKTGTVADVLVEIRSHIHLAEGGSGKLRLVEILTHKIVNLCRDETPLESLSSSNNRNFRVEEIPLEQMDLEDNELLVPVAHFQKECYSTFDHPFFIKLREGDSLETVRSTIKRHLAVPDKDFEKYRIAVVTLGRARYPDDCQTNEEYDSLFRVKDFVLPGCNSGVGNQTRPWIGLEHVNKSSKRARYNYMEKAIKIYN